MAAQKPSTPKKGIQVIARAASVLRVLENIPDGLSLGQIAKATGLSRSTVQRIVDALAAEHLVIAASPASGVKLGPAILRMASNSSFDFVEFIRPYIVALSREIGETVDVSEMQRKRTIFVDQVVGSARLNIVSPIGKAFPLHCLASGKAMLATLSEAELIKRVGHNPLERHTASTIINLDELAVELTKVRETHIAFDEEEHLEGVSAVGTSIQEPGGTLYALSIPVPTVRFQQKKNQLVDALLASRARIIEEIGL